MDTICNRQTQFFLYGCRPLTEIRETPSPAAEENRHRNFSRGLGLFDSVMLVVGAMIGSGIFIVPAEMARQIGSAGWLLVAWVVAGALTIAVHRPTVNCPA